MGNKEKVAYIDIAFEYSREDQVEQLSEQIDLLLVEQCDSHFRATGFKEDPRCSELQAGMEMEAWMKDMARQQRDKVTEENKQLRKELEQVQNWHGWVRMALGLSEDAPYRGDYYYEKIMEMKNENTDR